MGVTTVAIQGKVLTPSGEAPWRGSITAKLSQPGSVLDGTKSQRVTQETTGTIAADGTVTGLALVPNDQITPLGTYYTVTFDVHLPNGRQPTPWTETWQLASEPSPIDVGAVPRLNVVPGVAVTTDATNQTATAAGSTVSRLLKDRFADLVNVRDFGGVGDGVADDTAALDLAKARGVVYLPTGTYRYLSTPAAYVDVTGPGEVVDETGNPHPYFVSRVGSSGFLSSLPSYLAIINRDFTGDNGTRLYVLPRTAITSGVGGAIKIFADPYHLGADYRDFGIYFSANQGGVTGQNGNGVFWLNLKNGPLAASTYGKANPDLGFSFNDGELVAGRLVRLDPGGAGDRAHWYFGAGNPAVTNGTAIVAEFQKSIAFGLNGHGIYFMSASGSANSKIATDATGARIEFVWQGVRKGYCATNGWVFEGRIVQTIGSQTTGTTIDAANVNSVVVNFASSTTVTDIVNGAAGQEITLIFGNANATISNTATVKLAGGVNFVSTANDTLTLIYSGSVWYEKARSLN